MTIYERIKTISGHDIDSSIYLGFNRDEKTNQIITITIDGDLTPAELLLILECVSKDNKSWGH